MPPYSPGTFLYIIRPGDTIYQLSRRFHTTVDAIAAANPGINFYNLYPGQVIYVRPGYGYYPQSYYPAPTGISKAKKDLSDHLRLLWEQHVFWTRLTILSIAFGLPDAGPVTDRLLRNPGDFEAALRPFYGDEAASGFAALFKSHLVIAAELVKAAKAGDSRAAANAERRWYANADEIAAFLAGINPYWSEQDWKAMLHEHLALTKSEAVDMLTGKYAEGVSTFDQIERQALAMADAMTDGIIRQFPYKFI